MDIPSYIRRCVIERLQRFKRDCDKVRADMAIMRQCEDTMAQAKAVREEARLRVEIAVILYAGDKNLFAQRWPFHVALPTKRLLFSLVTAEFWQVKSKEGIDGNYHYEYAWQGERN
jgi:hypothetical protein